MTTTTTGTLGPGLLVDVVHSGVPAVHRRAAHCAPVALCRTAAASSCSSTARTTAATTALLSLLQCLSGSPLLPCCCGSIRCSRGDEETKQGKGTEEEEGNDGGKKSTNDGDNDTSNADADGAKLGSGGGSGGGSENNAAAVLRELERLDALDAVEEAAEARDVPGVTALGGSYAAQLSARLDIIRFVVFTPAPSSSAATSASTSSSSYPPRRPPRTASRSARRVEALATPQPAQYRGAAARALDPSIIGAGAKAGGKGRTRKAVKNAARVRLPKGRQGASGELGLAAAAAVVAEGLWRRGRRRLRWLCETAGYLDDDNRCIAFGSTQNNNKKKKRKKSSSSSKAVVAKLFEHLLADASRGLSHFFQDHDYHQIATAGRMRSKLLRGGDDDGFGGGGGPRTGSKGMLAARGSQSSGGGGGGGGYAQAHALEVQGGAAEQQLQQSQRGGRQRRRPSTRRSSGRRGGS